MWSDPDATNPSAWSDPSSFEMGLLDPTAWSAKWIALPGWTYDQPLPIFARQFTLAQTVRSARLYITGVGIYSATINGQPVTADVLTPGNTDYARLVEYATYDVSTLLDAGANAIGVRLGNGSYDAVMTHAGPLHGFRERGALHSAPAGATGDRIRGRRHANDRDRWLMADDARPDHSLDMVRRRRL